MKRLLLLLTIAVTQSIQAQKVFTPDLTTAPNGTGWKGDTAAVTLSTKDGAPALTFKPAEDKVNMIWLDGFSFTNGVIEFDVRGQSAPPQSSFVGIAFRVADAETYDSVYFRPFNYRASDPLNKAHSVQYISHPAFPWRRLREEKPGQYEKTIEPAPDGDSWVHARIVIDKPKVSVFVNGAAKPSLVVDELSDRTVGSVGLWCVGAGTVANLQITPKE